jgi:hypothetical protein
MKQATFLSLFLTLFYFGFGQNTADSTEEQSSSQLNEIMQLTKVAESEKYGLTGEMPIKVGKGSRGGPFNQRAYLELLRDAQGNPIKYERIGGGCCPYKSKNALFGDYALVDRYEVTYKDANGKKKKTILYISFYDYEEPMIPVGFKAKPAE